MTDLSKHLARLSQRDDGSVTGRVALVVLILAIVIIAALVALIVPN